MKQLNKSLKSDEILASFEYGLINDMKYINDMKSFGIAHSLLDALLFNHHKKEKGMEQL